MKIPPVEAELFRADGQTRRSFSQICERANKKKTVTCKSLFRCIIPVVLQAIRVELGYVKTTNVLYRIYYADDNVSATVGHLQVTKMYTEEN